MISRKARRTRTPKRACRSADTLLGSRFGLAACFCDTYAAWRQGGVDKSQGRIRRPLSGCIDLDVVTDEGIRDVAISLKFAPRKSLAFQYSLEASPKEQGKDVAIRFNAPSALRA
jgi:IS30 family transposase